MDTPTISPTAFRLKIFDVLIRKEHDLEKSPLIVRHSSGQRMVVIGEADWELLRKAKAGRPTSHSPYDTLQEPNMMGRDPVLTPCPSLFDPQWLKDEATKRLQVARDRALAATLPQDPPKV